MTSLWIHHLFRESIINSISYSLTFDLLCFPIESIFLVNSLRIHYLLRDFTFFYYLISLYESMILFAHWLSIPYCFLEFIMNPLFFANSLLIHYRYRDLTLNILSLLQINYKFAFLFANKLWIHFEYFILFCFANSVYIKKGFRDFALNFFTICFANTPWIHYLFRDFTINSLSI